jgi:hypothetical protein
MPSVLGRCDSLKSTPTKREQKGIFPVLTESHTPKRLAVTFDDDRAVAGAGLALVATLSKQLGTDVLADQMIVLNGFLGVSLNFRSATLLADSGGTHATVLM